MSNNPDTQLTLTQAVSEVLNLLTGQMLRYDPSYDRFRSVASAINRAQRANALEREWSWYSDVISIGISVEGQRFLNIANDKRPRIINDDAVRFCDATTGKPTFWAYFIPRDALHKYAARRDLKAAITRDLLEFSRPFGPNEAGYDIQLPIMREPVNFDVPADPDVAIDQAVLDQQVDFDYPDLIVARAAYLYAMTDPVLQPRAQTLQAEYKDLMYQVIEREERHTDTPFQNEFFVPVQNSIYSESRWRPWPLSDSRR